MTGIYRPLGLHERYWLSRNLVGFPPVIAIVSSIEIDRNQSIDSEISRIHSLLSERIKTLLEIVPFLGAKVVDSKSDHPKWSSRKNRGLDSSDILRIEMSIDEANLERILSKQLKLGVSSLDIEQGAFWRVDLHYSLASKKIYLGISLNHVLADGKGCLNLFKLLVSPDLDLSKELTTEIQEIRGLKEIPDPSDVCFNVKPSLKMLIKLGLKGMVIPTLPLIIRKHLEEKPFWPFSVRRRIKDCKSDLVLIQMERGGFTKLLKENCRKHGDLKTFHSALHSAIIVGILSLALVEERNRKVGDGFEENISNLTTDLVIKSCTPINLRKQELGMIAGNYISGVDWIGRISSESLFWEVAQQHNAELNNEEKRKNAMQTLGLLNFIPDVPKASLTEKEPTSWEVLFNSKESFGESFTLSNLGRFDRSSSAASDPVRIKDLAWCQTPSVIGSALTVDVCGLGEDENGERGGLSISIGFRDGALSRDAVKSIAKVVEKILNSISEGKIGKEANIWDLAQNLEEANREKVSAGDR